MPSSFDRFESIARSIVQLPETGLVAPPAPEPVPPHPFESMNLHPNLPPKVRKLFDDGHFAEATFHAFKFLDKEVQRHSKISESGWKLMMAAFDEAKPKIQLTPMSNQSEKDEQKGYRFIFSGSVEAIRNPRGHEYTEVDNPETCLDHLCFASMLLRRLEAAGFK
jgi:uncharacterized protein (TIGR02391 family)